MLIFLLSDGNPVKFCLAIVALWSTWWGIRLGLVKFCWGEWYSWVKFSLVIVALRSTCWGIRLGSGEILLKFAEHKCHSDDPKDVVFHLLCLPSVWVSWILLESWCYHRKTRKISIRSFAVLKNVEFFVERCESSKTLLGHCGALIYFDGEFAWALSNFADANDTAEWNFP